MSIDLSGVAALSDRYGAITQVTDASGRVLWSAEKPVPVVLQVAKESFTSYSAETNHASNCVLLEIYPKSASSKVNVTYGGLTKTLQFAGTNSLQVFFGSYNGASDSVETPADGELVIEGGYTAFGNGVYTRKDSDGKTSTGYSQCITAVLDWGTPSEIPNHAFRSSIELAADNYCPSFASLPDGIKRIGANAFYCCDTLAISEIPDGVKSIGEYAFWGCADITISKMPEGLESIEFDAFEGCTSIKSMHFPASAKDLAGGCFGCQNLEAYTVDSDNPNFVTVDGVVFDKNMTKLRFYPRGSGRTLYSIPSGVVEISSYAFEGTLNLISVTIPEGVKKIGTSAFYDSGLQSITLPASLEELGSSAFSSMDNLSSVICLATTPPSDAYVAFAAYSGQIIVPKGCGEAYRTAENWSEYADLIQEAT